MVRREEHCRGLACHRGDSSQQIIGAPKLRRIPLQRFPCDGGLLERFWLLSNRRQDIATLVKDQRTVREENVGEEKVMVTVAKSRLTNPSSRLTAMKLAGTMKLPWRLARGSRNRLVASKVQRTSS